MIMRMTSGNRAIPSHTKEARCISPTDKFSNHFLQVWLLFTISHLEKDKLSLFMPWEKYVISACRDKAGGSKQEVRMGKGKKRALAGLSWGLGEAEMSPPCHSKTCDSGGLFRCTRYVLAALNSGSQFLLKA